MESRIPRRSLTITAKPLVQLFALGLAFYTGYTRITDGMHHLHDVVVGYIVGVLLGYITVCITNIFIDIEYLFCIRKAISNS